MRPYDDPGAILPGEITRTLLDPSSRPLAPPLDYYTLRHDLGATLAEEGTPCLVFLIDQVEDILAPTAASDAKSRFRDFLREIHRCRDLGPFFRAVVSYRTEADAQLGRVWQEASGDPSGLPYHTLLGITPEDAETVICQVAERLDWKLEITPRELAAQLRAESRGSMQDGSVFPPYLQILLSTIAATPSKTVNPDSIQELGGVQGILTTYLRRVVDRLEERGGDYQRVRAVLQAVCRSSGEKLRQTATEIASYTGLSEGALRVLLDELVRQRLVRPLDGDSFEIRHDQLADVIIAELDPFEKEFKQATELLRSKAASFSTTRALLTEREIEMLFRHRYKLPTRPDTDALLAASVLDLFHSSGAPPVGWYWLRDKSVTDLVDLMRTANYALRAPVRRALSSALSRTAQVDIDYLTEIARYNTLRLRDGALSGIAEVNPQVEKLRALLDDENDGIRRSAVIGLRRLNDGRRRAKIRRLAKDDANSAVRRAALETLEHPASGADVKTLRDIVVNRRGELARMAVEILAKNATSPAIDALKYLAEHATGGNRVLAARALLRNPLQASSVATMILAGDDWHVRRVLAEHTSSLPILEKLSGDRAQSVRVAAIHSIGNVGTGGSVSNTAWQIQARRI